jgi:hypothetical protein
VGLERRLLSGHAPRRHDRSRDRNPSGTAETFEEARGRFEADWTNYLLHCTDADFAEERRHRTFTAWKYRMHDTGTPLPTAMSDGRSQCFCGAPLTNDTIDEHIRQAHMDMAQ